MKITSSTNTTITGIRPKVIETANGLNSISFFFVN